MPDALRAAGWTVLTHHDVYGARDEQVPDVEWLEMCGRKNLAVLTKDGRLRYRPAEIDAIRHFGVKAFVLTAGSLRAAEQAARFDARRQRIESACASDGPFVFAVQAERIVGVFPREG